MLKSCCEKYLEDNKDMARAIHIEYFNENCETLFPKLYPMIKEFPSLAYLDQNGVKFLSNTYLLKLEMIIKFACDPDDTTITSSTSTKSDKQDDESPSNQCNT